MIYKDLSNIILKAFFNVYNELGYGFLEKVYENSLFHEIQFNGLSVEKQKPIKIQYKGIIVGEFYADLLVENKIILELKAVDQINKVHFAQILNNLKATEMDLGFLLNFGKKPEFKRVILTQNNYK